MTTLPPHTVRESARAKHVHLRFSLRGGLEVVVPLGFDRREIPDLLQAKARWIARAEREMAAQRRLLDPAPPDALPRAIALRALGETWSVDARLDGLRRLTVREADGSRLVVAGPVADPATWRPALRRWVARRAKATLGAWVEREAATHGLRVGRVSIRWQRGRWGSCSRRPSGPGDAPPTLSLNAALLFLPPHLVRYVIVHELCHTERMDHSPAFWRRVEARVPGAQALRDELRQAWQYAPAWLEAGGTRPSPMGREVDEPPAAA